MGKAGVGGGSCGEKMETTVLETIKKCEKKQKINKLETVLGSRKGVCKVREKNGKQWANQGLGLSPWLE